ncbi:tRNA (N(6)-L-threonylcarbamoyladenosine(37)-C(2))-methylthiotransferase MtaB [Thermodesulfovibrionales bacterium]|nr:tRNA (N(6)-L-threonylcarbamoyladenosine(37)-C(2))-methylthiotransferase MtaB [Thermodesulfovibrionales bacterium]MCL0071592.1 tRNA (N(6)-L-threonylcarbamoyladenosine(37)-C(2))-methylthiotransferase MtaB [Thermodesulfovibrionales bacterium]
MKISVLTLGCKTNQAESADIEQELSRSGHQIVGISERPDVCVINTCSVTSRADYQSRRLIHMALRDDSKVIVTGCYAELNHKRLKEINGNIEIVRNAEKSNLINVILRKTLSNVINHPHPRIKCGAGSHPPPSRGRELRSPQKVTRPFGDIVWNIINKHSPSPGGGGLGGGGAEPLLSNGLAMPNTRQRPAIKVQDGCNNSCSYCAVPLARGKSRSIRINEVIEKIKTCESLGYKEVVLTGIHLGTYGLDLGSGESLSNLVKHILINTGIARIRLSSLEINEINEELLELVADDRICKHLHLPLQSGDDNILRSMKRRYSAGEYRRTIERLMSIHSGIAIGADVIVGFPGEGEAEFNNTKHLIEEIPFSYLHIFPYSCRPATEAATLPMKVTKKIKKERASILREIGINKKESYIKNNVGKIVDVIVEGSRMEGKVGTAGNYIKVFLRGESDIKDGMLVNVRISGYRDGMATGIVYTRPAAH